MLVESINLDGLEDADTALARFREQVKEQLVGQTDERAPLLELKLAGRGRFSSI